MVSLFEISVLILVVYVIRIDSREVYRSISKRAPDSNNKPQQQQALKNRPASPSKKQDEKFEISWYAGDNPQNKFAHMYQCRLSMLAYFEHGAKDPQTCESDDECVEGYLCLPAAVFSAKAGSKICCYPRARWETKQPTEPKPAKPQQQQQQKLTTPAPQQQKVDPEKPKQPKAEEQQWARDDEDEPWVRAVIH